MEYNLEELKQISQDAVKSNLFGMPSQEAAFSLMLVCQAEGIHPIQALRRFHIIKGRPAMRADAMQAAFQSSGGVIEWKQRDDKVCEATFSHPNGCKVNVRWTIEMAKQAGLINNDNWRKFPRQMLHARCVSEGVRSCNPAIVCGFYTPEEVSDFSSDPAPASKPATKKPVAKKPEEPKPIEPKVVEPEEVIPSIREVDKGTGAICGEPVIIAEEAQIVSNDLKSPDKPATEVSKTVTEQKPEKQTEGTAPVTQNLAWYWCECKECVQPVSFDKNKVLNTAMCPNCHKDTLHEAKDNTRAGAANERLAFLQGKKPAEKPAEQPKVSGVEMANKIQKAKAKAMEFGCRTFADLENFVEVCLGKRCSNLTALSPEELDKIINFKENA